MRWEQTPTILPIDDEVEGETKETTKSADRFPTGLFKRTVIEQRIGWRGRELLLTAIDDMLATHGVIVSEIREGKKLWYQSLRTYITQWAGRATVRFNEAYETSAGLVFAERVTHKGALRYEEVALTPPVNAQRQETSGTTAPAQ